jgi:retron-type reverse transcriptase
MKTYKNLYAQVCSLDNLVLAWKKARKGKTRRDYVIGFEKNLDGNLLKLHKELKNQAYRPKPLQCFILHDPKTRKISKSDFRDRIVHHALCNIIESIFERTFIYDSCANRKGKGTLFAISRFDRFKRRVSRNGRVLTNGFNDSNYVSGWCLKADIRHYFEEVDHKILMKIIGKRIKDEKVMWLIKQILENHPDRTEGKGMPLGNLTSQFFANLYLNELDYFIKHGLKAKHYARYVDDFVILHNSRLQLKKWKEQINLFLKKELDLELHAEKSRIIPLSGGIDFVGFRNFYHFRLLRKRNIRKMKTKISLFNHGEMSHEKLVESFQGWSAYAEWSDSYKIREKIAKEIGQLKSNFKPFSLPYPHTASTNPSVLSFPSQRRVSPSPASGLAYSSDGTAGGRACLLLSQALPFPAHPLSCGVPGAQCS